REGKEGWGGSEQNQAAIRLAGEWGEAFFDLVGITQCEWAGVHSHYRRRRADSAEQANLGHVGGIPQEPRSGNARRDLLEQLQPFRADRVLVKRKSGCI